jgi:septal ring factor EnvC (AmiA/AmiB activator)
MELLEEVRTRLNNKYHTLNKQLSTTEQSVRRMEETHDFRREVLARTLATAYTSKAVSEVAELGERSSGAERRRYFTWLVSQAQVHQVQQAADSLAAGEDQRENLSASQAKVKTAAGNKQKEKAEKERMLAKSEREAFGYRQRREQELDELEQIQREALILSELIDRLAALPGVQNAIDYDFPGWKGRLHWPLSGTVKSTVGKTIDSRYRTETFESGIFIAGKTGAPVVNAADGEIAYAGRRRGLGNVVVVGHGSGHFSIFAHLGEIAVLNGQVIRAGEPIGTAGQSHPRFGAGILFELRHEKEILDPLEWLK